MDDFVLPFFEGPGGGTLDPNDARLLLKLDELTVPKYRRQKRDAMRADDLAQEAGRATVGSPDTRMAVAMRSLRAIEKVGLIERAKEEEGGETIKYRISQLGEREIAARRMARLAALLDAEESKRRVAEQIAERLSAELADALRDLGAAQAPKWWQFWRG